MGRQSLSAAVRAWRVVNAPLTVLLSDPVARTAMIMAAVFVIDCLTPLGIAVGAVYIAAVLAAVAIRHEKAVFITAGICTLLVWVGWFVSPGQGQMEWWKVLINRGLNLGVIWVAASMADLWRRMQQRRSKEVLESRFLHQATALSASQLSLRDALKNSLRTLCDIVGWPAGHVYLRDNSGEFLVASDVWHTGDNVVFELLRAATRGLRFSQHEGAVGRAWSTGEPIAITDVSLSPDYAWLKEPERLDIAGAFLLPVTVGGKVVAVMEFFSCQPIHVDAEFMPLACNVGEQLGRLFERRKAEQTIRRSEERLRLALQGGGMGTWEWHMDSGQVIWSPELEELHGLAPGAFGGTLEATLQEVHPEDRQQITEAVQRVLQEGGEYRAEYRVIRPDGSIQWLEGRGAVQDYADGAARRLVGVCMNITDRKQFEEQNARLASIVQSSDDAIFAKTLDGTILSWNGGAERIYGYSAEEMVGQSVSRLTPTGQEDDIRGLLERLARGERIDHYETVRQRKDGQIIDVSLSLSPIRNSQGAIIGASAVASDITDRKKAEQEMKEAREKAEMASRLQSRFLANMSHELRTPMNSILGMLQLSLNDELTPEIHGWLETAKSSADSLLALLNDLLDFSKIEAGKLSISPGPFRLRQLVDEAIRAVAPRAFEKGLELLYDVDGDVPDRVVGDALRIRQVLTNLITNAIKFTSAGEVTVLIQCDSLTAASADIRFTITDTGMGISEEDQRRIFEPFTQSDMPASRHQGGAGLGLSICRELVRCMGGTLGLQSEVGDGSRFWFSLSLAVDSRTAEDVATASELASLEGLPVLVVDQNEASRRVLRKMLQRYSMKADAAVDYDHLIGKLYRSETEGLGYRLLIVDMETIGMKGTRLLERLAEAVDDIPATILLTRVGTERDAEDGNGDFEGRRTPVSLEKPVSPRRLLSAVRHAMGLESSSMHSRLMSPLSQTASRTLSILLAEDTPANQKVVTSVLSRRGHRVTVVGNGEEAAAAIERERFDVVLMDVTMPVLDGYESTIAIRQWEKSGERRVPIIALTAHAGQGDREKCVAVGMDAYLAKPLDVSQLIELVENAAQDSLPFERLALQPTAAPLQPTAAPPQPPVAQRIEGPCPNTEASLGECCDDEILDYRGALRRMGGDEGLFRHFVQIFDEDAPVLLHTIRRCINDVDAPELLRAAHSLKGLAASFGAKDTLEIIRRLEGLAQSRCLDDASEMADQLDREMARLLEALSPYRGGHVAESEAPPPLGSARE